MKTFKFFAAAIILLASLGVIAQKQKNSDISSELQSKLEQWKKAYNSGDAQNLVSLYAEDAIYTSSHVAGLEAIGRDYLIANFQNGISGGGHIDKIEILRMEVSCEMASLFCKYQATNAGVTVTGRNLLVLKKLNGEWVIVVHMTVV